jgi:hypothetical protein
MDAFAPDGYVLLPEAAPHDALAAYPEALQDARDGLLARRAGAPHAELATAAPDGGAVDPYAIVEPARTLLLAPALVDLLTRAYGDKPLLFDAVGTAAGSPDDGPYRDATYTALGAEPDTLVTIVVALAQTTIDVFPGSQDIATTPFSGRYAAFNSERDGDAALARHREELSEALGGAESNTITLNPGDALAWAAGLVHAAPQGDALVAHLCPARVQPAWFTYRPERARHAAAADGTAWLTTQHYDLVDAITPEPADGGGDDDPTPVEDERELQRVEAALREHDAEDAPPPEAPHASVRRQGGLVDSVRGLLGRRGKS